MSTKIPKQPYDHANIDVLPSDRRRGYYVCEVTFVRRSSQAYVPHEVEHAIFEDEFKLKRDALSFAKRQAVWAVEKGLARVVDVTDRGKPVKTYQLLRVGQAE
jgi:hypothetical protein